MVKSKADLIAEIIEEIELEAFDPWGWDKERGCYQGKLYTDILYNILDRALDEYKE